MNRKRSVLAREQALGALLNDFKTILSLSDVFPNFQEVASIFKFFIFF